MDRNRNGHRSIVARALHLLGWLALSGEASAQLPRPQKLFQLYDALVPGETIIGIFDGAVIDAGFVYKNLGTSAPVNSDYLIKDNLVLHRGGDPVPALSSPNATIDSFSDVGVSNNMNVALLLGLSGVGGGFNDSGVYFRINGALRLLAQENITQAPWPGEFYKYFLSIEVNNGRRCVFSCGVGSQPSPAIVVMDVDSGGTVTNSIGLSRISGAVSDLNTGNGQFDLNGSNQVLFAEREGIWKLYLGDGVQRNVVAAEGDPMSGEVYGSFKNVRLALNNVGGNAFIATLSPSGDTVLVVNGIPFIKKNDPMPMPSLSGFQLTSLGSQGAYPDRLYLSDEGLPMWYGKFSDPDTTKNEALFYGNRILVRKGVTKDNQGQTIKDFGQKFSVNVRSMSRNGRFVLFTARTIQSPLYEAVYLLDLDSTVPHHM
jgi:hypothetical protein